MASTVPLAVIRVTDRKRPNVKGKISRRLARHRQGAEKECSFHKSITHSDRYITFNNRK